jgi:WD40 repeat protein
MKKISILILALLVAQLGCRPATAKTSTIRYPTPSTTSTEKISTPTASPSPTLLPSPTQRFPVWAETSIPSSGRVIDPGNASGMMELARWMHGWSFQALYSPDGRYLAVGSELGVYLYDAKTLAFERQIEIPPELKRSYGSVPLNFTGIAFSPDGKMLATDAGDFMLIWDVDTGRRLQTFTEGQGDSGSVAFFPDGKRLAVGLQFNVTIWDIETGAETPLNLGLFFHNLIALSPDGALLAVADLDGEIAVWEFAGKQLRKFADFGEDSVTSLAFAPDGKTLAVGFENGTIKFWNAYKGEKTQPLISHEARVRCIAFAPDGKTLTSASADQTIKIWDLVTHRVRRTLKASSLHGITSVAFSPDGDTLLTATTDFTIQLRDPATGEDRATLGGLSTEEVLDIAFSPEGKTLAAGAQEGLRLWDVATGQARYTLTGENWSASSVSFSPDGKMLAAGNWVPFPGFFMVDSESGQMLPSLSDEMGGVQSVAFSPDGKTLALATMQDTVTLWDVASRRKIRTWKDETNGVGKLAFSPDGKILVSTGEYYGGKFTLWNSTTGKVLRLMKAPSEYGDDIVYGLAFSPDGKLLATGSLNTITIWDVASGKVLITTDKAGNDYVDSVAFSPDGRILASGSNTVILWEVATGKMLCELKGHYWNGMLSPSVRSVVFSPDGTLLASGSLDGTIRIWGLAP